MSSSKRDWPATIIIWSLIAAIALVIIVIASTPAPPQPEWRCLRYSPLDGECVLLERSR